MADLRTPMSKVVDGLRTKADKIRALASEGYSRSEIAAYMGIRYQHVRNVLVDDARLAQLQASAESGMAEASHRFEPPPETARRIPVGKDGEVRVPQYFLDAIGAKEGDALLVRIDDGEIRLITPAAAGRRVQEFVRKIVPADVNLADELIAERRLEAKRELEDE